MSPTPSSINILINIAPVDIVGTDAIAEASPTVSVACAGEGLLLALVDGRTDAFVVA